MSFMQAEPYLGNFYALPMQQNIVRITKWDLGTDGDGKVQPLQTVWDTIF